MNGISCKIHLEMDEMDGLQWNIPSKMGLFSWKIHLYMDDIDGLQWNILSING